MIFLISFLVDNTCDSTRGDPREQELVAEALLQAQEREAKTLLQNILQQSPQRLPYTLSSMYGPAVSCSTSTGKQSQLRISKFWAFCLEEINVVKIFNHICHRCPFAPSITLIGNPQKKTPCFSCSWVGPST